MKLFLLLLTVTAHALAVEDDITADITPTETVINFLKKAAETALAEKQSEEVQYAAFSQFCSITILKTERDIQENNASIALHSSKAEELSTRAASFQAAINGHEDDIKKWKNQSAETTEIRNQERASYDALLVDYTQSCEALKAAIHTLKEQNHVTKGVTTEFKPTPGPHMMTESDAAAFHSELLQTQSTLSKLTLLPSLLQSHSGVHEALLSIDDYLNRHDSAPKTSASDEAQGKEGQQAYKFQSNAIVELLRQMRADFTKEREDLQEKETMARTNYRMTIKELMDQIEFGTRSSEMKSADMNRMIKEKEEEEANVEETTKTMHMNLEYFEEVNSTCETKTKEFHERNQLRTDEIEAMHQATEQIELVLSDYSKHLKLLQMPAATALSQLRRSSFDSPQHQRLTQFLQERGSSLNSRVLLAVASRSAATPLDKVLRMIGDLIARLTNEDAAETSHSDFCETQLNASTATRTQKTQHAAELRAALETEHALSLKLNDDIMNDNATIARLEESIANATAQRNSDHAENTEALEHSIAGIKALTLARSILTSFLAKASAAAAAAAAKSLLQIRSTRLFAKPLAGAPQIFDDKAYLGQSKDNNNILAILDVVDGDFQRMKELSIKQEASGLKQFDNFLAASYAEMNATNDDKAFKTKDKLDTDTLIMNNQADLNGTNLELEAAETYFLSLKSSCISTGESDADRVQKRQEEMQALQEALTILEEQTPR